jgi:hypothetical protein
LDHPSQPNCVTLFMRCGVATADHDVPVRVCPIA